MTFEQTQESTPPGAQAAGTTSPASVAPAAASIPGIAVMGSHPQTKMQAPFDEGWLIYACSPHNWSHGQLPRVDQWFEVHVPLEDFTRPYGYLRWLEQQTFPIWMRHGENMKFFPTAKPYPEREMKARFGPFVFTSSIAYILAKAIVDCEEQKIPSIGLYGIMQASQNEFTYQRPGIQHLLWEAMRLGIKVRAPDEAKLLDPPPENF